MVAKRFPIEPGHVMTFARAIGDPNPIYYPESGDAQIAPPTFIMAAAQFDPDTPIRPHFGQQWFGSGREPTSAPLSAGAGGRGLHAEQHFEYYRHLRPGDVLSGTERPGRRWEKEGRRSGKLLFEETITEYRDEAGDLVITARFVSVITERPAASQ